MSTASPPTRARAVSLLVAVLLCLAGSVALGTSAGATGHNDNCPGTTFADPGGGWVKYERLGQVTTFTYPQKPGYVVEQVCYKASTTVVGDAPVTGTVTSQVFNRHHIRQNLSHVSVKYVPRPVPPKPWPLIDIDWYLDPPSCETPTVLVGKVVTTTDWVFNPTAWAWEQGQPTTFDWRVEKTLTAEEVAACWPKPEIITDVQTYDVMPSCATPTTLVGTVTTTTDWVFDPVTHVWSEMEPVVLDERVEYSLTEAELAACQPKPDAVVVMESYSAAPSCETPTVLAGTVTTTTEWVFDSEAGEWVKTEPVVVDGRTGVSLSAEELAACGQTPQKPEPVVTVQSFSAAPTCAAPTVLAGTVTTTTDWVLDANGAWVPGQPTVVDGRTTVALSAAELLACQPTQPVQPVQPVQPTQPSAPTQPTPVAQTAVSTAPRALAQTGSGALLPTLTALGLVLLGTAGVAVRRRMRDA